MLPGTPGADGDVWWVSTDPADPDRVFVVSHQAAAYFRLLTAAISGDVGRTFSTLPRYRLRLVDVFGRSRFATSISQVPGRVVLSSAGAVAWVEGSQLRALRAGDPARTPDTGTIDPHSLRIEGLVVSWTRDGTPMSADLAA